MSQPGAIVSGTVSGIEEMPKFWQVTIRQSDGSEVTLFVKRARA